MRRKDKRASGWIKPAATQIALLPELLCFDEGALSVSRNQSPLSLHPCLQAFKFSPQVD